MPLSSRNVVLAGILISGVFLAWDTSAARAQGFFPGPEYGFSRYYDPPGGWPRFGYYGLGSRSGGNQTWAYRQGGPYMQGWQQRPYPYVQPGYGPYLPRPSPSIWPW